MENRIFNREIIKLSPQQEKMILSGWGREAFENSVVERITYLSDGLLVKGYIAYPKDSNGKCPCIIWNRGGSLNDGATDSFTARGIFGQMASWGYVIFASQYRGNAGSQGKEQLGGNDVNDILNLIPLADEIPIAEKNSWGMEGWSRGGMMTYLTLLKNPNFSAKDGYASGVKCAILSGAISNLKKYVETNPDKISLYKNLIEGENFEEEIEKRTVINFVDKLPKIPYLLLHGGEDKIVSPLQTIYIAKKMHEMNYLYRLVILEGGDHFLKNHRKEVDRQRRLWFDKYLKAGSK